jgi:hypothetical protein
VKDGEGPKENEFATAIKLKQTRNKSVPTSASFPAKRGEEKVIPGPAESVRER